LDGFPTADLLISGGSALGGFLGTMLTRGDEKEVSNYYDQAVRLGKILVAVDRLITCLALEYAHRQLSQVERSQG
jgi:hypothetical protein